MRDIKDTFAPQIPKPYKQLKLSQSLYLTVKLGGIIEEKLVMRTRLANVMSCSTFEVVHVRDSLKERNARHCATLCKSEYWRVLPDRSEGGEDCGLAVRCYRFPLWAIFHSSLWSLTSCSGLLRFPCSLLSLKNLMAIRKLSAMLKRTMLLSLKLYICLYNRRYNRWLWKLTAVSRGLRCDISEIKSIRTRDETQL